MEKYTSMKKRVGFDKSLFVGINKDKEKLTDKYNIIKKLGKGEFGKVYEVEDKTTGDKRACKVLCKKKVTEDFKTEKDILLKVDSPYIVKLLDIYEDKRYYLLIMEECMGGEITTKLCNHILSDKMYTERDAAVIMKQILLALAYCHKNGICHRDLKFKNILYATNEENSNIKIIDFGLSQQFRPEEAIKMTRKVGTSYFMAPEVLRGNYTEKCDIWSAGVILYILLCGCPPFDGKNDNEIYAKIKAETFTFSEKSWAKISNEAKDLIRKMMCKEEKRISAAACLAHPWFIMSDIEPKFSKPIEINITHLKDYIGSCELKKMALTFIAARLNEDDITNLKEKFILADKDKNGLISFNEMNMILRKYGCSGNEITDIFNSVDTNLNGNIEYTEFIAATLDAKRDFRDVYLYEAFQRFDRDGDGKISQKELMDILRVEEGDKMVAFIDQIIKKADLNKDGYIDYQEFLDLMLK